MAERGMGGSGAELMARLGTTQSAANRSSEHAANQAIAAAEAGVNVILATKGSAAKSGATPMACPSYQAAFAMDADRDFPMSRHAQLSYEDVFLGCDIGMLDPSVESDFPES